MRFDSLNTSFVSPSRISLKLLQTALLLRSDIENKLYTIQIARTQKISYFCPYSSSPVIFHIFITMRTYFCKNNGKHLINSFEKANNNESLHFQPFFISMVLKVVVLLTLLCLCCCDFTTRIASICCIV